MRQVSIIGISGNALFTSDGSTIYPIGNKLFTVGDIVWTNGRVAFGHETGGGAFIPVVDGSIPVLYFNEEYYHFGIINNGAYQEKTTYSSDFLYRSIFVNDKNHAYFILANGDDHDSELRSNTAYNLLTGETAFDGIEGLILDSNVSDDGGLYTIVWQKDIRAIPSSNHSGTDPSIITEANIKLYKNDEVLIDFSPIMKELFNQTKTFIKNEYAVQDLYLFSVYINTRNVIINKEGNCSFFVSTVVPVSLETPDNISIRNIYWSIKVSEDGGYTIKKLDKTLEVTLNEEYYYTGVSTYPNNDSLAIFDFEDNPITVIDSKGNVYGYYSGSTFDIVCTYKTDKGYLTHCRASWNWIDYIINNGAAGTLPFPLDSVNWQNYKADNNRIVLANEDNQTTVIELEYGFNSRFAKMMRGHIGTIQTNLKKILEGAIDGE